MRKVEAPVFVETRDEGVGLKYFFHGNNAPAPKTNAACVTVGRAVTPQYTTDRLSTEGVGDDIIPFACPRVVSLGASL